MSDFTPMILYYSFWIVISFCSFFSLKGTIAKTTFTVIIFLLFLMTGLRYEVGADWLNYLMMYDFFYQTSFSDAIKITDPAYGLINYISQELKLKEIILVNLICAIVFYLSIYNYSKDLKYYWIPLLISYPYLILVVSMGYTRQSVAIALSLISIKYLLNKSFYLFLLFFVLAFVFHKSAIIILIFFPLFTFVRFFKNYYLLFSYALVSFVLISVLVYLSSLSGSNLYTDTSAGITSSGALFRIFAHSLAIFYYILYRKKLKETFNQFIQLYDYMALLVVYVFILAIFFSTLADRFNLYLIVFDILIFTSVCSILNSFNKYLMLGFIIIFNTIMITIWLNFGAWSHAWIPYQNYLINFLIGAV